MDINTLDKKLSDARNGFAEEVERYLSNIPRRQDPSISEHDLDEVARQAFYALCGFQEHIIAYLKEEEKKKK